MRQYHFVVFGTVTPQGHVEFHIDEETADANFPDGRIYDEQGNWQLSDEDSRDEANFDLLAKTLEKRIKS